jgi:hypothetical protein
LPAGPPRPAPRMPAEAAPRRLVKIPPDRVDRDTPRPWAEFRRVVVPAPEDPPPPRRRRSRRKRLGILTMLMLYGFFSGLSGCTPVTETGALACRGTVFAINPADPPAQTAVPTAGEAH